MYSDIILLQFFQYFIVIVSGLAFGSFSTAMIYRIPRSIPWAFPARGSRKIDSGDRGAGDITEKALTPSAYRSACTNCGCPLRFRDLFPVISWVLLRGKCSACHKPFGLQYLVVELIVLLSALLIYAVKGFTPEALLIMTALPFLTALFFIDLEYLILPNQLVAILAVLGLGNLFIVSDSLDMAALYIAAAVFFGVFSWLLGWILSRVLKKEALGFGDVKFFALVGLWLGFPALAPFFFLSGALGVALSLLWKMLGKGEVFPFGPALILSFFTLLIVDVSLLF